MDASAVPYKFAGPWAADATAGYATNPVPATASGAAASQQLGFPPLTATPTGSGGTPPNIADFNGLEFYNTSWLQWVQAGGPIAYDATLSSNIGGYPRGAVLQSAVTFGQFWQSTVDNNTSDPDTGGANWQRLPIGLSGVEPLAIASNTTLTLANWGQLIEVGNGVTVTTPNASAASFGMVISFYFRASNTLTLGSGSFFGGGLAGSTLANPPNGSFLSIVCDGANWLVLSSSPDILGYATQAYVTSAVATETTRAETAEALKANLSGATFTGSVTFDVAIYPEQGLLVGTTSNPIANTTNGCQVLATGSTQIYDASVTPLSLGVGTTGIVQAIYYGATQVGSISTNGTGTAYNVTSDETLKVDDGLIRPDEATAAVMALRPTWFRWKSDVAAESEPGFFAQHVHRAWRWAVSAGRGEPGDSDYQPWQMDAGKFMPLVIVHLQDLERRNAALELHAAALERRLAKLESAA
jgi:hypothetical protein